MPRLETIARNSCAPLNIMLPRLKHIQPSNHATKLLWSRLIQFKCVTADLFHDYLEQEARKGKGAFIQDMWTVIGKPKLYNLVTKDLTEQTITPWIHLAQMVFRHLHKHSKDPVCCPECLEPMTLGHFYYKHAPKTHTLDSRKQCIFLDVDNGIAEKRTFPSM
ncbi:hypothetical protein TNCV_2176081 [Trichonephila clavipes]|uniref:Uncharacterized protein n=1 Tax=Trichonephila clavipes TaxID=2585209 RepID=A0A8X6S017_TRICX|nr:hypothetical protein TNCV_2176081 [Trichonephila clavipes]